jgi:hypothetical protein
MITVTMTVCTVVLPQIASGLCMSKIVAVGMRGRRRPGQQNRKAGKINMLKKKLSLKTQQVSNYCAQHKEIQ